MLYIRKECQIIRRLIKKLKFIMKFGKKVNLFQAIQNDYLV